MLFNRLFRPRPAKAVGQELYLRVVDQSRIPALYAELGVPDTVEGRFEVYTLHVVLVIERLRADAEQGAETSQALFDTYVTSLDHALREMGVGDLSVGKKMRKLGEALFGRARSYETAFQALPATELLEALLIRTIFAQAEGDDAARLAAYVLDQRAALAAQPLERLLAGDIDWKPA